MPSRDLFPAPDDVDTEAERTIAALQEEIEIRDQAHEECLADLEWCANNLALILRDGAPEWLRSSLSAILTRINRNI
jgi:hypothetical protein